MGWLMGLSSHNTNLLILKDFFGAAVSCADKNVTLIRDTALTKCYFRKSLLSIGHS